MPRKKRPGRLIDRSGGARLHDVPAQAYVTVERPEELCRSGYEVVVREVETGRTVTEDVLRPGLDG